MTEQFGLFDAKPPKAWRASALRSLHVRSHQRADEAKVADEKAQRQEDAILQHFRFQNAAMPGVRFTPSEVWRAFDERWPLTSVRARMTTLHRKGLLIHFAGHRRQGIYGKPESCWGLAR